MTAALIGFAAVALLAVAVGELAELPFARRKAGAGRSRLPPPAARGRLRR